MDDDDPGDFARADAVPEHDERHDEQRVREAVMLEWDADAARLGREGADGYAA